MDAAALPAAPLAPPVARRRPRTTGMLLRAALTLHAVAIAAQPVLIGGYLDGNYDLLGVHGLNGSILVLWTMLAGAAALAHWLRGGRAWPLAALTVLFLAEGLQIGMGFARVLVVHVALGVAIVAASFALLGWAWTRQVHAPRTGLFR